VTLARGDEVAVSRRVSEMLETCNGCGRAHDVAGWRRLELVDRLADERLTQVVTSWQNEVIIEVRRCACGELMARKRTRSLME
jgi:hypothetical protein